MPADLPVARLRVEGELTIASVRRQAPDLLAAVAPASRIELDLAGVTHLDGAGLQLLLLLAREATRRAGSLRVADASPAVFETLALARLDAALQPVASNDVQARAAA